MMEEVLVPCALVVTGAVTTWAGVHLGTHYVPKLLDHIDNHVPKAERTELLREDKKFKWPQLPKGKPRETQECVINIDQEDDLDEAIQEHEDKPVAGDDKAIPFHTTAYAAPRCCICNRIGSHTPAKNGKHYCKACKPKEE